VLLLAIVLTFAQPGHSLPCLLAFRLAASAEDGVARRYEDLGGWAEVKGLVEELLVQYNSKRQPLQLVFFEDALEHLTRIVRTMRLPQVSPPADHLTT
jgi:hypothetical protein